MATSNLVQYLGTGPTPAPFSFSSDRRTEETFLAGEAIVVGDAVSFDLSQAVDSDKTLYVVKADTGTATDKCFVGVALEAQATVGGRVRVCIAGVCEARVNTALAAAGEALVIGATAGELAVYAAASLLPIAATSCEADTAGVATIFVIRQF
jgi:phage tail sheath gpL-like